MKTHCCVQYSEISGKFRAALSHSRGSILHRMFRPHRPLSADRLMKANPCVCNIEPLLCDN